MPGKRLYTKLSVIGLLVLLSGKFISCEPEDLMFQVDCADCYGYKPDSANLIIHLSINAENDSVPLTFYRGNFEDGEIDWQDTATTEDFYLYSKINSYYTVRATYRSGSRIIEAFDGDKMTLYDGGDECGSPCYIVKGGIFDLRLVE
jgi:hypothetical protein